MNKTNTLKLLTLILTISLVHLTAIAEGVSPCCASGKGIEINNEEGANAEKSNPETRPEKEETDGNDKDKASSD